MKRLMYGCWFFVTIVNRSRVFFRASGGTMCLGNGGQFVRPPIWDVMLHELKMLCTVDGDTQTLSFAGEFLM